MNIKEHIMEIKRSINYGAKTSADLCTVRLKDIRRVEQVSKTSNDWPDDDIERVYLVTQYDNLIVEGNYKEINQQWINYMEINGVE